MGDPTDTIRRATLMPGQMLDSLSSHRLSYMVGQTDTAGTRAHRHSLLPGQLPARTHSSSLQNYPLSPEVRVGFVNCTGDTLDCVCVCVCVCVCEYEN